MLNWRPHRGSKTHFSFIFVLYVGDHNMQPLYTEAEFKAAKSRQLLPLRCIHCTNTFVETKHQIVSSIRGSIHNTYEYCSPKCGLAHQNPPIIISCEQCKASFKKLGNQIKKYKHHFCSRSCAAKWNNAHKTKGTRVSKLEVWLSKQLPALYPSIEFHLNRKDAINGELDIFIPSLKLAFELNGIFHYEPIYGPEKLASIQTNDTRKTQACFEKGIELCLIDVSSMENFKEHRAQKFLDIIKNIIDLKLSRSSPVISNCLASTT
jgi:hypothetical protein